MKILTFDELSQYGNKFESLYESISLGLENAEYEDGDLPNHTNRKTANILNKRIQQLPKETIYILKLADADQNYEMYKTMANYFNLTPLMSEKKFLGLKKLTAKASENKVKKWIEQEEKEFLEETKELKEIYDNELCKFSPYYNKIK